MWSLFYSISGLEPLELSWTNQNLLIVNSRTFFQKLGEKAFSSVLLKLSIIIKIYFVYQYN